MSRVLDGVSKSGKWGGNSDWKKCVQFGKSAGRSIWSKQNGLWPIIGMLRVSLKGKVVLFFMTVDVVAFVVGIEGSRAMISPVTGRNNEWGIIKPSHFASCPNPKVRRNTGFISKLNDLIVIEWYKSSGNVENNDGLVLRECAPHRWRVDLDIGDDDNDDDEIDKWMLGWWHLFKSHSTMTTRSKYQKGV